MLRSTRLQTAAVLAVGALLGYLAAAGRPTPFPNAGATPAAQEVAQKQAGPGGGGGPDCCSEGVNKGRLLAMVDPKAVVATAGAHPSGKKANILVIFGDDIGQSNLSAYTHGLMGYRTPNIDRIAREEMLFTDYYAEQSCTAGRSSFITGQCTLRTGPSKVGIPGAAVGLQARDVTIAQLLKPLGYATGQFGKNHLGDRNEYLPTVHGFDEFFGNLYHLNAEEDPESWTYPRDPKFKGGFPSRGEAQQARDDADYQRAVTAYRFWYPTVSCEGIFNGNREKGVNDNESIAILSAGPRHVAFTPNSDTPYGAGCLDLKDGPFVVEMPPGPFIGLANSHHQSWILDMGLPGPDAGKGGKHLVLPPGYKGEIPQGYYVGKSPSNKVLLAVRALPARGDVKGAIDALRTIKIYPLVTVASPKLLRFVDISEKEMDGPCLRWEDNLKYWQKLHEIIGAEPLADRFLPMYGQLAALGIEKSKPFAPDARMRGILEKAARAGRDQMLVSAFASGRPDRFAWKDRRWEWAGLVPESAQFETKGGVDLEARDRWFAQAIVTSPAMFRRTKGAGSLYWLGHRDATGAYVGGGKTYKLTVPLPVPAGLFWSVTVYDAATRSQIKTAQDRAALRPLFELKDTGDARAIDLYFGPKAPPDKEGRWIQTLPGKGWFAYFRIYGPTEPAFDATWKPGDFEEVK